MQHQSIKQSALKATKALGKSAPLIIGTLLLISLLSSILTKKTYLALFHNNYFLDPLIGSLIGSISAGTPITSYIIGGELLAQGISLLATTAFLVAWVTVGIIQMPAEATILGKKFTLLRNISAFVFAILVAIITVVILNIF